MLCTDVPLPSEKIGKRDDPGGGRVLPYKRLIGMCRWMGWHFHDCSDYNGVVFSIDLLEWSRKFSDFWGKYRDSKCEDSRLKNQKVFVC